MKVVRIEGGIGNRMFQYALFRVIEETYGDAFLDETSFSPYLNHDAISLNDIFPNILYKTTNLCSFKWQTKSTVFYKIMRNLNESIGSKYILEKEFKYYPSLIQSLPKKCYLRGFWQTEKYFSHIKTLLLNDLAFSKFSNLKNIQTAEEMFNEESVSIHIRKGLDYQKLADYKGTCEREYYERAIRFIEQKIKNPHFYLFTDNPKWVVDNIQNIKYTLVTWNPVMERNTYLDMQLMSQCKHNIIANSSYSWWGAWLNLNPQKIVIAPKIWFNPSLGKRSTDIVPSSWIML